MKIVPRAQFPRGSWQAEITPDISCFRRRVSSTSNTAHLGRCIYTRPAGERAYNARCSSLAGDSIAGACFRYFQDEITPRSRVCAARALHGIPAALIGNWEIAGIRSRDVSQSEDITVIGHLKLPERKVTFVLARRTFGKTFYVTTCASRIVRESRGTSEVSSRYRLLVGVTLVVRFADVPPRTSLSRGTIELSFDLRIVR